MYVMHVPNTTTTGAQMHFIVLHTTVFVDDSNLGLNSKRDKCVFVCVDVNAVHRRREKTRVILSTMTHSGRIFIGKQQLEV